MVWGRFGCLAAWVSRSDVACSAFPLFPSPLAYRRRSALRVGAAWLGYMHTGAPIVGTKTLVVALHPLAPLIEAVADRLKALVEVNRAVYLPFYNRLISEAVAV